MKSIGIFCGSSAGEHPLYLETARLVGRTLAQQGLALVYGGGKVGLMGAVADAALEAGGVVIGVMPRGLVEREIAHRGLTELHVVEGYARAGKPKWRRWRMALLPCRAGRGRSRRFSNNGPGRSWGSMRNRARS